MISARSRVKCDDFARFGPSQASREPIIPRTRRLAPSSLAAANLIRCAANQLNSVGGLGHQLYGGAFVTIGGAAAPAPAGAGDSTNVTHTFQPSGRFALSNSA